MNTKLLTGKRLALAQAGEIVIGKSGGVRYFTEIFKLKQYLNDIIMRSYRFHNDF
jgi:hypothetical protein